MDIKVKHSTHSIGTPEHYRHYADEFKRIKELADNQVGEKADELYFELDGIRLILEEYEY